MNSKQPRPGRNPAGNLGPSGRLFLNNVVAEGRTRQLQVATGGRYKYLIQSKIINFLKIEFLEAREKRPTLDQLLDSINEPQVSNTVKAWLSEEILPNHPRVRVVSQRSNQQMQVRYAYEPPLKNCSSQAALLKILKTMHKNDEGGLLRSLVEDSMPVADRFISNLLKENKILQVARLDKNHVLYYKPREPELDNIVSENRFVELWRKVDVCNKEMSHIHTYLKNQGMSVFNEESLEDQAKKKRKLDEEIQQAKALASSKPKRQRKVKDNAHIQNQLIDFRDHC